MKNVIQWSRGLGVFFRLREIKESQGLFRRLWLSHKAGTWRTCSKYQQDEGLRQVPQQRTPSHPSTCLLPLSLPFLSPLPSLCLPFVPTSLSSLLKHFFVEYILKNNSQNWFFFPALILNSKRRERAKQNVFWEPKRDRGQVITQSLEILVSGNSRTNCRILQLTTSPKNILFNFRLEKT